MEWRQPSNGIFVDSCLSVEEIVSSRTQDGCSDYQGRPLQEQLRMNSDMGGIFMPLGFHPRSR